MESHLPRTIRKLPLSAAGATPSSTNTVEKLLERDRNMHHCLYNTSVPFHNHLSHHLLAAYDLGADTELLQAIYDYEVQEGLISIFTENRPAGTVERQADKVTRENWKSYLGIDNEKYYANLLEFFSSEVQRLGPNRAFEQYVFSPDANDNNVMMVERFVHGAIHPLIQMGYALEFDSPAMVAQALAQTAIHPVFHPDLYPWNHLDDVPSHETHDAPRSLFHVIEEAYNSDAMERVMPYNENIMILRRWQETFTPERCLKLRKIVALWLPSTRARSPSSDSPDIAPDELDRKVEELSFLATLAFAGTGRRGLKHRLDFFLMHLMTSSMFIPHLLGALTTPLAKSRLLGVYFGTFIGILLSRGTPTLDAELLMSFSASPRGPTVGAGDTPAALGRVEVQSNPWATMLPHALPARDAHVIKVFRALYVYSQRYGTTPQGKLRISGNIGKELDGSVFVRAAGVLLDTMGWIGVGGGQKDGVWDRSALGWDEAWEEEIKRGKL